MKSVVAFGLCIILMSIFAGERGLPAVFKARREAHELSSRIAAIRAENADLKARAEALRTDPATIERVARETLGFARPDELVVTGGPTGDRPPASRPPSP
jgi:cell division protein FtsB